MVSWGEVDCFACFVGGVAWRPDRISQKEIALFAACRPNGPADGGHPLHRNLDCSILGAG
jgi:hypothetical protein